MLQPTDQEVILAFKCYCLRYTFCVASPVVTCDSSDGSWHSTLKAIRKGSPF